MERSFRSFSAQRTGGGGGRAGCSCHGGAEFDARQAFERLSGQFTKLGRLVNQYMAEAGTDPKTRVRNARRMSEAVLRIVGGVEVEEGQFPEVCGIGSASADGSIDWFCTGTLFHRRAVLTAAHCVDGLTPNRVLLRGNNLDSPHGAEILRVRRAVIHPDYVGGPNDLAVLILRTASLVPP